MQKLTSTLLVFCLLIFLCAVQVGAQDQKAKMAIDEPNFNAGEIYRSDGSLEHAFVIKNAGDAELKILSARPG
jgi:hypothetical protein